MIEELKQHAAELEDLKNEAEVNATAVQKNFEMLKNEYSALHKEIDLLKTANSRSEKSVRFFMNENTQLKSDLTFYKQECKTLGDSLNAKDDKQERRRSKDFEQQLETVNKQVSARFTLRNMSWSRSYALCKEKEYQLRSRPWKR